MIAVDTDWFNSAALGVESRLIQDSQFIVSSKKDSISGPDYGRLNENATTQSVSTTTLHASAFNATANITMNMTTVNTTYVRHGGWIAAEDDHNPWFQIDFRTNVTITAIRTQGLDSRAGWVTRYKLNYGYDGDEFLNYNVNGQEKVMWL